MKVRLLFLATLTFVASLAWAAPSPSDAQVAFARLKSLAGEWESTTARGGKFHAHYEVISGGSAVLERFEGDEMGPGNVMVTVYYLDGGRLLLQHYCMAHNQPRMQAQSFDNASGELQFTFLDATGLSSPEAGHMHNATFRFVDADHLSEDWQFFEGGKPKLTESVQYTRSR